MESSRDSGCRHELGRLVQFCACRKPTIAICRVMLFSLSAGLLGETQLTRDLVFGRKRAQFVPGRVLDLDADLATFLLPQIFDLARIEHAVRAFGRWRRFEVTCELGDLFLEVL